MNTQEMNDLTTNEEQPETGCICPDELETNKKGEADG